MKTKSVEIASRSRAEAAHASVSHTIKKKHWSNAGPTKTNISRLQRNIVGCRIQHRWKEANGSITHWKGTILDQVSVNPTLYLIKYVGYDMVYGLELFKDERVSDVEVLPGRVEPTQIGDVRLADTIIGKAVEHMFKAEDGSEDECRGIVLAQAPILSTYFYISYENDNALYMYQLLDDYKNGDLRIMTGFNVPPSVKCDSLVGKKVECAREDGSKRTGMVIHQVEAKPSVYFIKFDDDFQIYVYNLMKIS